MKRNVLGLISKFENLSNANPQFNNNNNVNNNNNNKNVNNINYNKIYNNNNVNKNKNNNNSLNNVNNNNNNNNNNGREIKKVILVEENDDDEEDEEEEEEELIANSNLATTLSMSTYLSTPGYSTNLSSSVSSMLSSSTPFSLSPDSTPSTSKNNSCINLLQHYNKDNNKDNNNNNNNNNNDDDDKGENEDDNISNSSSSSSENTNSNSFTISTPTPNNISPPIASTSLSSTPPPPIPPPIHKYHIKFQQIDEKRSLQDILIKARKISTSFDPRKDSDDDEDDDDEEEEDEERNIENFYNNNNNNSNNNNNDNENDGENQDDNESSTNSDDVITVERLNTSNESDDNDNDDDDDENESDDEIKKEDSIIDLKKIKEEQQQEQEEEEINYKFEQTKKLVEQKKNSSTTTTTTTTTIGTSVDIVYREKITLSSTTSSFLTPSSSSSSLSSQPHQPQQQASSSNFLPNNYIIVDEFKPRNSLIDQRQSFEEFSSSGRTSFESSINSEIDNNSNKKNKNDKDEDYDNDDNDDNYEISLLNIEKFTGQGHFKDYHWNSTFQSIIELPDNDITRPKELSMLVEEFVYNAQLIGRLLISQVKLSKQQKTIPLWDVGGIGGGLKYKCNDIIFKFVEDLPLATDPITLQPIQWIYGGNKQSNEKAKKAASHEIKSLNHFKMASNDSKIRTPLMAVIDYLGYRLIAISYLPININNKNSKEPSDTLVYGSRNGGAEIKSNSTVEKEMRNICEKLNLSEHTVKSNDGKIKTIYGPVDFEIHYSHITREYYAIDFQRLFPPEDPYYFKSNNNNKNGGGGGDGGGGNRSVHLYRLLRPELVSKSQNPLSSDGFSKIQDDDDSTIQNQKIRDITHILHTKVIPEFIKYIDNNSIGTIKSLKSSKSIHDSIFKIYNNNNDSSSNNNNNNNNNDDSQLTNNNNNSSSNNSSNNNRRISNNNISKNKEWISNINGTRYINNNQNDGGGNNNNNNNQNLYQKSIDIKTYIDEIHSCGINLRYLGMLSSKLKTKSLKSLLQSEMAARVWKVIISRKNRESEHPSEGNYKLLLSNIFELILSPIGTLSSSSSSSSLSTSSSSSNSENSENLQTSSSIREFWCNSSNKGNFKFIALQCFHQCISIEDQSDSVDYRNIIDNRFVVFRIIQMLNIKINQEALNQFCSNSNYIITFNDIEEIGSKIKYPSIIDVAAGSFLLHEAMNSISGGNGNASGINDNNLLSASRLCDGAKIKFHSALRSMPLSIPVMLNLGASYLLSDRINNRNYKKSIDNLTSALNHINSNDAKIKALKGVFCLKLATIYLFYFNNTDDFKKTIKRLVEFWNLIPKFEIVNILLTIFNHNQQLQFHQSSSINSNNNNNTNNTNPNNTNIILEFNESKVINELITLCIVLEDVGTSVNLNDELFSKIYKINEFSISNNLLNYFNNKYQTNHQTNPHHHQLQPEQQQQIILNNLIFSKINNLKSISLNDLIINEILLDNLLNLVDLKIINCEFLIANTSRKGSNNSNSNSGFLTNKVSYSFDPINEILIRITNLKSLYIEFSNEENHSSHHFCLKISNEYSRLKSLSIINYLGIMKFDNNNNNSSNFKQEWEIETLNLNHSLNLIGLIKTDRQISTPFLKSLSIAGFPNNNNNNANISSNNNLNNNNNNNNIDFSLISNNNMIELDLSYCTFSNAFINQLFKDQSILRNLKILKLKSNRSIQTVALNLLSTFNNLQEIYLDNINIELKLMDKYIKKITNKSLIKVLHLPNLISSVNSKSMFDLLKDFKNLIDLKLPSQFNIHSFLNWIQKEHQLQQQPQLQLPPMISSPLSIITLVFKNLKILKCEKCTISIPSLLLLLKISPFLENLSLFGSKWNEIDGTTIITSSTTNSVGGGGGSHSNKLKNPQFTNTLADLNPIYFNNIKELNVADCDLSKKNIVQLLYKLFPMVSILKSNYLNLGHHHFSSFIQFIKIKLIKK